MLVSLLMAEFDSQLLSLVSSLFPSIGTYFYFCLNFPIFYVFSMCCEFYLGRLYRIVNLFQYNVFYIYLMYLNILIVVSIHIIIWQERWMTQLAHALQKYRHNIQFRCKIQRGSTLVMVAVTAWMYVPIRRPCCTIRHNVPPILPIQVGSWKQPVINRLYY